MIHNDNVKLKSLFKLAAILISVSALRDITACKTYEFTFLIII